MPDPAHIHPTTVIYEKAVPRLRRTEIRTMAETLSTRVAKGRGFTCLIAPPKDVRRLNRDFRGKDTATDVLSFPAGVAPASFLGDLAISVEHARDQAKAYGHSVENEIGVLMLHGLLHLLGMDHEADEGEMRRAEARWRRKLDLPLSLTERVATKPRVKAPK